MLPYLGDLRPVFAAASAAAAPGAVFAFTLEDADGEGYELPPTGRFRHAPAYALATAADAGWAVVAATAAVLRINKGTNVNGHVYTFRRDD